MDEKYNVSFFKPGHFAPVITCDYHIHSTTTLLRTLVHIHTIIQVASYMGTAQCTKSCRSKQFSSNVSLISMAVGASWAALNFSEISWDFHTVSNVYTVWCQK